MLFRSGSAGVGTSYHLWAEAFSLAAGISPVHVPYKGEAPATTDLLGGQIQFALVTGVAQPNVANGKLLLRSYTDNRGGAAINTALSAKRAEAVRAFLSNARGLAAGQFAAEGLGVQRHPGTCAQPLPRRHESGVVSAGRRHLGRKGFRG